MNTLLEKEKTTKENRIWIRISAACNEKCLFCLDSEAQNGKLIEEEKVKKQIRDGYKLGVYNRVILSWWEASINPKFPEYIRYAKEIWYNKVQTVTNGNMFARKEFCEKVFDAGLDEVTFSLHGHTATIHDYLTATPGSFDKWLRGLLNIRKFWPHIIINIDIVVCKVNVDFLPAIVRFFMRLWVMEFDILQIIPFGRWFSENKNQLFYKVGEKLSSLHETWKLSKVPWMYMWTNRFPVEAFEWHEDLIQDPRKIKSEVMGEALPKFQKFIESGGIKKPDCYGERCDVCFLEQYCHDFIKHQDELTLDDSYILRGTSEEISKSKYIILKWEEFPSEVYRKYGSNPEEFINYIQSLHLTNEQKLVNIPRCIREKNNDGIYEWYGKQKNGNSIAEYTKEYIMNLYRKKSTRCSWCKHNKDCHGIHINFIRSYGFWILKPVK
jgi:molybdenum cofactor biosynthesis enzyme MoaA